MHLAFLGEDADVAAVEAEDGTGEGGEEEQEGGVLGFVDCVLSGRCPGTEWRGAACFFG